MYIFVRKMTYKPTKYVVFDEVYSFTTLSIVHALTLLIRMEYKIFLLDIIFIVLVN